MKKCLLVSLVVALIVSLAAPAGAVFAAEAGAIAPIETGSTALIENTVDGNDAVQDSVEAAGQAVRKVEDLPVAKSVLPEHLGISRSDEPVQPTTTSPQVATVTPPDNSDDDDRVPTGDILVTAVEVKNGSLQTIELTNTTAGIVRVEGWKIVVTQFSDDNESVCEIDLVGYMLARRSVTFVSHGADNIEGAYRFTQCDGGLGEAATTRVSLEKAGVVFERVKAPNNSKRYERRGTTATYKTGTFAKDFKEWSGRQLETSMIYEPPASIEVQIIELHPNPLPCTPLDDLSPDCTDYVKLYNPTDTPIDLARYRLRVGQLTSSSTSSNTYQLEGVITEKSYALVSVHLSNDSGTAWLQDEYGVMNYPSGVTPYEKGALVANKGRSWAYNAETHVWQWATPAPWSVENDFTSPVIGGKGSGSSTRTLVPCRADQYRNPGTNRCRKIASTSALTPCREGQYRNPETNRCRSLTSVSSSLKACRSDQFRNPETNRCKKIASAIAELKDCGEGRERNPETNRCRNIKRTAPSASDFAVEDVAEPASVFIGWWVLGGIAFLAIGYAGWEWREEIGRFVRRVFRAGSSSE